MKVSEPPRILIRTSPGPCWPRVPTVSTPTAPTANVSAAKTCPLAPPEHLQPRPVRKPAGKAVQALEPAGADVAGARLGGRVAGLAATDLAQQFLGRLEDLRDLAAEGFGVFAAGHIGVDAGLLKHAGQVGQPDGQVLHRIPGQVPVELTAAGLPAGEGRVVVGAVKAARFALDRLEQVDPPDGLADRDRLGRVLRAPELTPLQHPHFQPDPVLRVLPTAVRVRVFDVDVAEQDPDPVEAKRVEHRAVLPGSVLSPLSFARPRGFKLVPRWMSTRS